MKATVVEQYGDIRELRLCEIPEPEPGPGEVAIDVAYAGVNFAEVMARRGSLPAFRPPFVPGLEVSGVVRSVGAGVEDLAVGQAVSALTMHGGYAEVAVAKSVLTYPLGEVSAGDLRAAAACPTIVPTAWALVHEVARLRAGESVLVQAAAGGVGTVVGQMLAAGGAGRVLGVVSGDEKARYAAEFGYDDVFVGPDWAERVHAATGGRGLDIVLDSVGGDVRRRGYELLAPLGRLVCFGNASDEPETGIPESLLRIQVKAVLGWSITGLASADPERASLIARMAFDEARRTGTRVDITDVIPLDQVARAHTYLEDRRSTGKLVLAVSSA